MWRLFKSAKIKAKIKCKRYGKNSVESSMQYTEQWRCQDLLQGGAKLEIRSRGTHGGLQGCSSCLRTNSFVTNAVLIECELLTFAPADLADYTIFGYQL